MRHYLKAPLLAIASAFLLAGCHTVPEIKTVVEYRNVAVKVPDHQYETKPVPVPTQSREELKTLTPREMVGVQSAYISDLHKYIGELLGQIAGIRKASNDAAKRIEQEQKK